MTEAVRGAACCAEQSALGERAQLLGDVAALALRREDVAYLVDREVATEHARGLQHELLPGLEMIDSAHDDALNRVGHREAFEAAVRVGESARTRLDDDDTRVPQ